MSKSTRRSSCEAILNAPLAHEFEIDVVLLDIEGTTSSIHFVAEVLFPFARQHVSAYLQAHETDPETQAALDLLAVDAGHTDFESWCRQEGLQDDPQGRQDLALAEVHRLMDRDAKATGLKHLQGLVWRNGFLSGELRAHVYGEVPERLRQWHRAGLRLYIYSSGSIQAQKLFFGHTIEGDLLPLFLGHFDTTIGSKREAESYRRIAQSIETAADRILFVSDLAAEIEAAAQTGMKTVVSVRPGNAPLPPDFPYPQITSFEQLRLPDHGHVEIRR